MRAALLRALGTLEERRELLEACVTKSAEGRHRRTGVDTRRALQVRNLERDALVLRALRSQFGRTWEPAAGAEVGVAVETARDREEVRPGDRLLVLREPLLLRPRRD